MFRANIHQQTQLINTSQRQERLSRFWENAAPYVFISPFFIGFVAFQLFPILFSAYLSLANWNPYIQHGSGLEFVGADHFTALLKDERFIHSLQVTGIITISCTMIGTSLSVLLAVMLDKVPEWLSAILRAVFFMPSVTSVVVTTYIWKQLLNNKYGYLNSVVESLGFHSQPWLADPMLALWSIIIMLIWAGVGWDSLIIMSGLRSIPQELYEAARIDGANGPQEFWHITLPMLRPVLVFVVTTGFIYLLGIFAPIQLLTEGKPLNKTETVALYLYKQSFDYQEFGYASAIAVALTAIMFLVSFLNYRFLGRDMEYAS
jgi:ABC-type sugar transport system permease subunit